MGVSFHNNRFSGKKLLAAIVCLGMLLLFGNYTKAQPGQNPDLNGSDEEITVPDDNSLDITNALTISFWVNLDDISQERSIIQKGASTVNYGIFLKSKRVGSNDLVFESVGSSVEQTGWGQLSSANEWGHYALVFDNGEVTLYLNGKQDKFTSSHGTSTLPTSSSGLSIGNGFYGFLDGEIDEVRIWNEARSAKEVKSDMHRQLNPSNHNNLVAYYRFDGDFLDETSNNNDGNPQNFSASDLVSSDAVITSNSNFERGGAYDQNIKAIWPANSQTNTDGGLQMLNHSISTAGNYIIFGHNGGKGIDTLSNNTTIGRKFGRDWRFDVSGSASPDIKFITAEAGEDSLKDVSSTLDPADYFLIKEDLNAADNYSSKQKGASSVDKSNSVIRFNGISFSTDEVNSLGTKDGSGAPLPVELIYFQTNKSGNDVKLAWSTASETQNKHFLVQRKTEDAEDWSNIGEVKGNGTTLERQNYTYTDPGLDEGTYYYRLKQVDYDGSFEIHPVEVVTINGEEQQLNLDLKVQQNPVRNQVRLSLSSSQSGHYRIMMVNVMGEVVKQEERYLEKGQQTLQIPFHQPEAGVYFIRLQSAVGSAQVKILKTQ